jgi:hypothetical protein
MTGMMTEDGIIAHMEQHEDDWDEIAFNGHGTGWIARRGRFTLGWLNEPSVRDHRFGEQFDTAADASASLREWVVDYLLTTDYTGGSDLPSITQIKEVK